MPLRYLRLRGKDCPLAPHEYFLRVNELVRQYKPNYPPVAVIIDDRVQVPASVEYNVDIGQVKNTSAIKLSPSFFKLSKASQDIVLKHEVAHIVAGRTHASKAFHRIESKILDNVPYTVIYWRDNNTPVMLGVAKSREEAMRNQRAIQLRDQGQGHRVEIIDAPPDLVEQILKKKLVFEYRKPKYDPYAFLNW